jgi:dihydropyrimidine dehydrogenase (NAD+) subunit PreA
VELVGQSVSRFTDWKHLNLEYKVVAQINQDLCIHCNKCYIACEDAAHQCIHPVEQNGIAQWVVDEAECVGCNLCAMVCPIEGCITMADISTGSTAPS